MVPIFWGPIAHTFWSRTELWSAIITELCSVYKVKKSRGATQNLKVSGNCERFKRTLHDLLRHLDVRRRKKWSNHQAELLLIYNWTSYAKTGMSPHFLDSEKNQNYIHTFCWTYQLITDTHMLISSWTQSKIKWKHNMWIDREKHT